MEEKKVKEEEPSPPKALKKSRFFYVKNIFSTSREVFDRIKAGFRKMILSYSRKERTIVGFFTLLIMFCLAVLSYEGYLYVTKEIPEKGGKYIEGIVGKPENINPLFANTNDVDRDISKLVFSGLVEYDSKGKITGNLASSWEVTNDGKRYTFHLKEGLLWHDGEPLDSSDVIFTIERIQDPDYEGPLVSVWKDVKAEAPDGKTVVFTLKEPFAPFIHNVTLGIIPKHIWERVKTNQMQYSDSNLEPIGSGLFKYKDSELTKEGEIKSISLGAFGGNGKNPYIDDIELRFYRNIDEVLDAYSKREILGFANTAFGTEEAADKWGDLSALKLKSPRYNALFFNYENPILSDKKIRKVLELATDKKEIAGDISKDAKVVDTALLEWFLGYNSNIKSSYNPEEAIKKLEEMGWKDGNGDGVREKGDLSLELTLTTLDTAEYRKASDAIRDQWSKIGIKLNVETLPLSTLQQERIRPRSYSILLYGENLGADSDIYPFWHSYQRKDPGVNLTGFKSNEADKLLEDARRANDSGKREKDYYRIQEIIAEERPAIFLYNLPLDYRVNRKVRGITAEFIGNPSDRFSGVENWYIKYRREFSK